MKTEEIKNYGKDYTQTMGENAVEIEKLFKQEAPAIIRKHLGLLSSLRLLYTTGREKQRLSRVDMTPVRQKGLKSESFIKQRVEDTAQFSAMAKIAGKEKTLAITHEIMDKVAIPLNDLIMPPVEQFLQMEDIFKAQRDFLMAFFIAEKNAGLHEYEVIEDSKDAIAINVTYCAFCEIPRLCGIIEACDPSCYGDEVSIPYALEPLGIRFIRTKTLARGGDCCDYRFERILN